MCMQGCCDVVSKNQGSDRSTLVGRLKNSSSLQVKRVLAVRERLFGVSWLAQEMRFWAPSGVTQFWVSSGLLCGCSNTGPSILKLVMWPSMIGPSIVTMVVLPLMGFTLVFVILEALVAMACRSGPLVL
jgi:hypothetical protein